MAEQRTIHIDPVTRIEGHLKAEVVVEDGVVVDAKLSGGMFRGFEHILKGRDPRDAPQITQRICGVCPASHATASSMAVERACGVTPPTNGRVTRNLIQAANYLQSHVLHFYHLAGQDFIQGPEAAPFLPRFEESDLRLDPATNQVGVDQYLEALEVRRVCHEMVALLAGRMPHLHGVIPGGVSQIPTQDQITEYAARFASVRKFVEEKYLPVVYLVGSAYKDLCSVAPGTKNCMCAGVFPLNDEGTEQYFNPGVYYDGQDYEFDQAMITEDLKYSWFNDNHTGRHFSEGMTEVDLAKDDAYSFVKAPRYNGQSVEVGPHARMWIANKELSPVGKQLLKEYFGIDAVNFRDIGEDIVFSIMGRHIGRVEETWHLLNIVDMMLAEVQVNENTYNVVSVPDSGEGFAFSEAPRGSLLHYVKIENGVIDNYQLMPATLWNCCPRDDKGQRGPVEEALIGVPMVGDSAVNVSRVIRAFDP